MKNMRFSLSHRLFLPALLAAALALIVGCAATTTAPEATGARLMVKRSFSLGGLPVALLVDGKQVGTIGFNQDYVGGISPGSHLISVEPIPSAGRPPATLRLSVQSGQTYSLTAARVGSTLVLR